MLAFLPSWHPDGISISHARSSPHSIPTEKKCNKPKYKRQRKGGREHERKWEKDHLHHRNLWIKKNTEDQLEFKGFKRGRLGTRKIKFWTIDAWNMYKLNVKQIRAIPSEAATTDTSTTTAILHCFPHMIHSSACKREREREREKRKDAGKKRFEEGHTRDAKSMARSVSPIIW